MSSPKCPRYMNFERKSCYNDPIRGYFMNKFKAKSVSWWKIVVLSSFTHCKLSMCIFVIIPLLSTILCYLPLRFCFFQASIQLYGSKPRKIIHCQRSEYFVFIWGGGGHSCIALWFEGSFDADNYLSLRVPESHIGFIIGETFIETGGENSIWRPL